MFVIAKEEQPGGALKIVLHDEEVYIKDKINVGCDKRALYHYQPRI